MLRVRDPPSPGSHRFGASWVIGGQLAPSFPQIPNSLTDATFSRGRLLFLKNP